MPTSPPPDPALRDRSRDVLHRMSARTPDLALHMGARHSSLGAMLSGAVSNPIEQNILMLRSVAAADPLEAESYLAWLCGEIGVTPATQETA